MKMIKRLREGKKVYFDAGLFDNFCVYYADDYRREALKDGEYFKFFNDIKPEYEDDKVFNDFMKIYNITTPQITTEARDLIDNISLSYKVEHQINVEKYFTIIYGGMVAELNKEFTMLGKKIKLLGMHQVLKENYEPEVAADFSRNKPWKELQKEMQKRNI